MSMISYEGIGQVVITAKMDSTVKPGDLVRYVENDLVYPCNKGEQFIGVALSNDGEYGGVQVKGFFTTSFTGNLDLGWNLLVGDGYGGMCQSDYGINFLVTHIDRGTSTAAICL